MCVFLLKISCRDCRKESRTVFHVIGLKCMECGAYNTVRTGEEEIPPDAMPPRARELRERHQRRQQEQDQRLRNQDDEVEAQDDHRVSDNADEDIDRV